MTAPSYRERRISAQDGLALYARDYGDPLSAGMPLLCLTGLVRNSKDFAPFAERHAEGRRLVCPDYRGRGLSARDPDWRNYRPEVYLNDVGQVMAACHLHRVVVCGTSLGGLLAMGLAALKPTALAGVVLNDVGPEIVPSGIARIARYVGRDHPHRSIEEAAEHLKTLFPHLALEGEAKWRWMAEATYRLGEDGLLHSDWDPAIAKALQQGGEIPDLWPLYGALGRVPVLAIRGAESDVLSEATFARMAELKPDLIRVTVPGVGHVPQLDDPAVEPAVDRFLAEIDKAEAARHGTGA